MTTDTYTQDVVEAARQEYRNYIDMLEREKAVQLASLRSLEQSQGVAPEPEKELEARPVTAKYEYGYSSRYAAYGIR